MNHRRYTEKSLNTSEHTLWANLPSITEETFSFQTASEHNKQNIFCPMTSNPPPEIQWHFIDALHFVGDVKIEGKLEARRDAGREVGGGLAVIAQWLWRRLDDWVHL